MPAVPSKIYLPFLKFPNIGIVLIFFIEAINSPEFSKKISDPIWHSRLILHKKNFFCNFKMRNFFDRFTFCIQPNKKARFGYAILLR